MLVVSYDSSWIAGCLSKEALMSGLNIKSCRFYFIYSSLLLRGEANYLVALCVSRTIFKTGRDPNLGGAAYDSYFTYLSYTIAAD